MSMSEKQVRENESRKEVSRIPVTIAKAQFTELMRRVQFGSERIIMTNHGQDAAALVPVKDVK